ncbi:MAG: hypothetical protein DI603_09545 [Roseateles depolymerans]|uniref:LuxR family transcriptional regulator n=1 Tax=Roseateles depolymerans TaxID=76731 RepID=A0A2W5DWD1_9BURK|nr:MAG: hypothetical protein DI603_09545 [Roseateles depolymerans]
MKPIATILLLIASLAQPVSAADAKLDAPLMGSWAVDTSRLPMAPAVRPRSVTITFSASGAEQVKTKVEVIDSAGNRLEADGVTPLDGTPTPVKSNFEADISATLMPRPDVLIMQLGKNGVPASTRIYAVQADGNSMIETVAHFDAEGRPVLRKNYFSRVR